MVNNRYGFFVSIHVAIDIAITTTENSNSPSITANKKIHVFTERLKIRQHTKYIPIIVIIPKEIIQTDFVVPFFTHKNKPIKLHAKPAKNNNNKNACKILFIIHTLPSHNP